jgi:hypothetical protein
MVLGAREGVTALRPSIALTAAALVLLTRGMSEFVAFNLPVTFALVIVVRLGAGRPLRSTQWTWKRSAAALLACGALGATTVSYGRLHALSADAAEISKAHVTIPVRGIGDEIVNLISVRVPDAPAGVMHMKVGDRELHQTVRLDRPVELCA